MLRFTESEAWKKTPYQIVTLFQYHKEYNPQRFKQEERLGRKESEQLDDIDEALGGL